MLILGCRSLFIMVAGGCMLVGTLSVRDFANESLTDAVVGSKKECACRRNSAY